jgi:hypothetical protein
MKIPSKFEYPKTVTEDYPFETRNGIKGLVENVEFTIEIGDDGKEEKLISAKESRRISEAEHLAGPDCFVERTRIR